MSSLSLQCLHETWWSPSGPAWPSSLHSHCTMGQFWNWSGHLIKIWRNPVLHIPTAHRESFGINLDIWQKLGDKFGKRWIALALITPDQEGIIWSIITYSNFSGFWAIGKTVKYSTRVYHFPWRSTQLFHFLRMFDTCLHILGQCAVFATVSHWHR